MLYTTLKVARLNGLLGENTYPDNYPLPLYVVLYLAPVEMVIKILGRLEFLLLSPEPVKSKKEIEQVARLVAIECGEYVLPIYEECVPQDTSIRSVIEIGRNYAHGGATEGDLLNARTLAETAIKCSLGDERGAWEVASAISWAVSEDVVKNLWRAVNCAQDAILTKYGRHRFNCELEVIRYKSWLQDRLFAHLLRSKYS